MARNWKRIVLKDGSVVVNDKVNKTSAISNWTHDHIAAYMQEQMALAASKGHDPNFIMTHEIIPAPEYGKGFVRIVRRDERLDLLDIDFAGHSASIIATSKLPSELLMGTRSDDEAKLFLTGQEICSVESKELQ